MAPRLLPVLKLAVFHGRVSSTTKIAMRMGKLVPFKMYTRSGLSTAFFERLVSDDPFLRPHDTLCPTISLAGSAINPFELFRFL